MSIKIKTKGTIVVLNLKGGTGKSTTVLSIANLLGDSNVDIVSLDSQDTLGKASSLTGRFKPVNIKNISKDITVVDTPPYISKDLDSICDSADLIIIPSKLGYPDLLAVNSTYNYVKENKWLDKSVLFFNEVRLPKNRTDEEIEFLFKENYKDLIITISRLSQRNSFKNVFLGDLEGKAKNEAISFLRELNFIF